MGPGGSRETPKVQKSLPGGSREALEAQKSLPGGSREAPEAQRSLLGGPEAQKNRSPRPLGSPKKAQNGSKCSIFKGFRASPGTPQAVRYYPPGTLTRRFWGPGGRLQRGVPSLRTSEFWRPDLW